MAIEISLHPLWEIHCEGMPNAENIPGHQISRAQDWVATHLVTSIVFRVEAWFPPVSKYAYSKDHCNERTITAEELAVVSDDWVTERVREVEGILRQTVS